MNIYLTLIKYEWYAAIRSPMWAKNLISLIVSFAGFAMFLIIVPMSGYYFGDILFAIRPGAMPYMTVAGYLPQYFITTTVFLAMSLNASSDIPTLYLIMPRMRGKVVRYLLSKSLLHGLQRLFILFFVPFAWHYIVPEYGLLKTVFVIFGYLQIHLITTLLVLLLKNMAVKSWLISLGAVVVLISLTVLNKLGYLDTEAIGWYVMEKLVSINILFHATLLLTFVLLMEKNFMLLSQSFTADFTATKKTENEGWFSDLFLNKLPITWLYLFRLIGYDNLKRPSFMIAILAHSIFMGLFVFVPTMFANTLNMLMYFQMLGSSLVVNVLPSFFTFSSSYMDGLATRKINLAQLVILHYRMLIGIYFILLICWMPFLYWKTDSLALILALSLFHAGFTACVYMLNAYFFAGRVEIGNKKANAGGSKLMGGSIAALLGVWGLTMFLYGVIGTVLGKQTALIIMGSIGLLFIATHSIWLKEIMLHFDKNKYKKLTTYRAK